MLQHSKYDTRELEIESRAKGKRNLKLWELNFPENWEFYLIFVQTRNWRDGNDGESDPLKDRIWTQDPAWNSTWLRERDNQPQNTKLSDPPCNYL